MPALLIKNAAATLRLSEFFDFDAIHGGAGRHNNNRSQMRQFACKPARLGLRLSSKKEQVMPTILIVEDDIIFARLLARELRRRDYAVDTARDLADAEHRARASVPDVILLDVKLASENGLDFLRLAHSIDPSIKIVVLTGYGDPRLAASCVRNGAVDCIAKPVDAAEIDFAIQRVLKGAVPVPASLMPPRTARNLHIREHFEKNDGNVTKTARDLGMHRRTLQRLLERMGVTTSARNVSRFGRAKRLARLWMSVLIDKPRST